MRETRSSGSVRGASGDGRPYRERISPVAAHSGDRLLSEPTAGTQPCRREPLFMPLSCHRDSSLPVMSTSTGLVLIMT
jgi:hypothetical protein